MFYRLVRHYMHSLLLLKFQVHRSISGLWQRLISGLEQRSISGLNIPNEVVDVDIQFAALWLE